MSTLRVTNIEAKADGSSPSVNEKVKITNSNGDVLFHLDGKTSGITTVGINTTGNTFTVNNTTGDISFSGSVTSSGVSTFTSGLNVTGGNVGINETSPDRLLHITVGSDTALAKFENSASSGRAQVQYVNPHGDWVQGIEGGFTTGDFLTYTADSKNIKLYTAGAIRQKIQGDGKIIVGGNADQTANRNLSVVAASGNSNNTEIGLQPTNSSGGYIEVFNPPRPS